MAADQHWKTATYDELCNPSDQNQKRVGKRIRELRKLDAVKDRLASKVLLTEAKLDEQSVTLDKLNHFINGTGVLSDRSYRSLAFYLWDNKWFSDLWLKEGIARQKDALFHALSLFLEAGVQTAENLAIEAPGTYRLWRPAVHIPGRYVRGRLDVMQDAETFAMHAVETHVFKGEKEVAALREVFEGYMIKKSSFYVIFARQAFRHAGPPRVTMVHNATYDGGRIQSMHAVVTGSYGVNEMFTAPVYIERVPEDEVRGLNDELDIPVDIPAAVKANLHFHASDGLIRF